MCRSPALRSCPGDPACSVDVGSSHDHCGECERACPPWANCAAGRCVGPALQPLSPISTLHVTSPRPWLRWVLPDGAVGARIQVCATRTCDRIEAQWDAAGVRSRVPTALAPGVHFWRLFARRGDVVDATPGAVWEFVVPSVPARESWALQDVNGDGLEDRLETRQEGEGAESRWEVAVFFGRTGMSPSAPDQVIPGGRGSYFTDGMTASGSTPAGRIIGATGDLDGDGYGDVMVAEVARRFRRDVYTRMYMTAVPHLFFGGPGGLRATSRELSEHDLGRLYEVGYVLRLRGDRDGDGFGDVVVDYSYTPYQGLGFSTGSAYLFGGQSMPGTIAPGLGSELERWGEWLAADFNADGATDLARLFVLSGTDARATTVSVSLGRSGQRRPPPPVDIDRCGTSTLPPLATTLPNVVLDANDDGYDDLRVELTEGTALFRGGPGGLSSERCEMLPRTP